MKKTKEEKYNLFKEKVIESVRQFYGDGYDVSVHPIQKNNGLILYGLNILKPDTYVCPTIYLEDFFERYENGCAFSTVFREIIGIYEKYKEPDFLDLDFFSDYERVRKTLSVKLINAEYNRELLEDVPYRMIEDLAVVCFAEIISSDNHIGSVLIHNNHICMWGIRAQEVLDEAIENAVRRQGFIFRPLTELIMDMYEDEGEQIPGIFEGDEVMPEGLADDEQMYEEFMDDEVMLETFGDDEWIPEHLEDDEVMPEAFEDDEWIPEHFVDDERMPEAFEDDARYACKSSMYVLSNRKQMFGAAVMTYPGILDYIGDKVKCNYFIIPSSIHELIILPENISGHISNINEMISSINSEMLSKEEVLSNHAYLYDINSKSIISVTDEYIAAN